MAGSLVSVFYETDIPNAAGTGNKYTILRMDESNAEIMDGELFTTAGLAGKEMVEPQDYLRLEPRKVYFTGTLANGDPVKRAIVAPEKTSTLWESGGTVTMAVFNAAQTVEQVVFTATGAVGEKRTFPQEADTGLTDGD